MRLSLRASTVLTLRFRSRAISLTELPSASILRNRLLRLPFLPPGSPRRHTVRKRTLVLDLAGGLKAAEAGHADVHRHHDRLSRGSGCAALVGHGEPPGGTSYPPLGKRPAP